MAKKQDLIGYCGLYCGDCPGYTQTVANLARDLRKQGPAAFIKGKST
jgi:hypothetical protein